LATPQSHPSHLEIQSVAWQGLTWIDVERPGLAEMGHLGDLYGFHPLALEDCLSRVQLPKVDEYDNHLFIVTHFPVFNRQLRIAQPSQVSVFASSSYIVTVHRGDLRPMTKLFRDAVDSESVRADIMSRSSGYLLYRILDMLVDDGFPILNRVIQNVDGVGDRLLGRPRRRDVQDLAVYRRDIISYRRIIRPQIGVMELLERKAYPFLKVDPGVYFGDLADHTRRIWEELEELKEVADGLHDTIVTTSSYVTNDVMRALTMLATVLLPVLLVSGLYGMNVRLPLGEVARDSGWTFWIVLGASLGLGAAALAWFRFRGWT
jgi:magnesium transporter